VHNWDLIVLYRLYKDVINAWDFFHKMGYLPALGEQIQQGIGRLIVEANFQLQFVV